jgi:pimeloyl-ACP methyl ester carboxylesterase
METHDGLQLHVRADGPEDAPVTVVLAHCWTSDHDSWRYQVRDLRARFGHDVRILAYDHRGHGQSDPTARDDATIENLGRDLEDLIELHAAKGALVLAGHSLGGMTIMELTSRRPDLFRERVKGVMFVATSGGSLRDVTLGLPDFGDRVKDYIPYVLAFRSKTLSRRRRLRAPIVESIVVRRFLFGDGMRLRDHMLTVEGLVNTPADSMTGFFEDLMLHDRAEGLTEVLVDMPVVVLVGDHDVLTPVSHARRLTNAIPGARLIISPGAGHMLPLECDDHVSGVLVDLVSQALDSDADREAS